MTLIIAIHFRLTFNLKIISIKAFALNFLKYICNPSENFINFFLTLIIIFIIKCPCRNLFQK